MRIALCPLFISGACPAGYTFQLGGFLHVLALVELGICCGVSLTDFIANDAYRGGIKRRAGASDYVGCKATRDATLIVLRVGCGGKQR